MKIVDAAIRSYNLSFSKPVIMPLKTAEATTKQPTSSRSGFILRLTDSSGRSGFGEATTWPGFGSDTAAIKRTLELLLPADGPLLGRSFKSLAEVRAFLEERSLPPETSHAVELALLDLLAQLAGASLAEYLSPEGEPRSVIELHTLVSDPESAKNAVRLGARALKIKIGQESLATSFAADYQRLEAIRAAVGPDIRLRLDANGAWSDLATAISALERLKNLKPEWIEEPLDLNNGHLDYGALKELKKHSLLPLALDESVKSLADLEQVITEGVADILVLKPMFKGGFLATKDFAAKAQEGGLKLLLTHSLGSAVERTAAIHFAAALKEPLLACGLADPGFRTDIVNKPVKAIGGWVNVPSMIGLGVDAEPWFKQAEIISAPTAPLAGESARLAAPLHEPAVSAL